MKTQPEAPSGVTQDLTAAETSAKRINSLSEQSLDTFGQIAALVETLKVAQKKFTG